MGYNPKHSTILVVNEDGSGFLRQYETYTEAREAYKLISEEEGKSVYLYPPAIKSISYEAAGTPPPISSTDLEVVDGGITRKPVSFQPEDNGKYFSNKVPSPSAQIQVTCEQASFYDDVGTLFTSSSRPVKNTTDVDSNGNTVIYQSVGAIGSQGCNFPNGFKELTFTGIDIPVESFKIDSMDSNGTLYGEFYFPSIQYHEKRSVRIHDGQGGFTEGFHYGLKPEEPVYNNLKLQQGKFTPPYLDTFVKYQEGDIPKEFKIDRGRFVVSTLAGSPVQNGNYLVSYIKNPSNISDGLASGYWSVRMTATPELGEQKEFSPRWRFIPLDPEDPPPPQNSVRRVVRNEANPILFDEFFDDTFVKNPYRIEETGNNIEIEIEGSNVIVGSQKKKGINDGWGTEYWGQFNNEYIAAGIKIHETDNWNYFSDGNGGFTQSAKNSSNCDPAGTIVSSSSEPVYVVILGTDYEIGQLVTTVTADGNCGEDTDSSTTYLPVGDLIVVINEENYRSDGNGGYNIYPIAGQQIGSSEQNVYVTITEESQQAVVGTRQQASFTDGFGGSYDAFGETTYYPYGTDIYDTGAGGTRYFSDGLGGYLSESIPCDDAGTVIQTLPTGTESIFITEVSETVNIGDNFAKTYADGFCGTYTENITEFYAYGFPLTVGNGLSFFADGAGGYYYESVGCDPMGYLVSSSNIGQQEIYINEIYSNVSAGDIYENIYADGFCGTYTENPTEWYVYGTLLTSDSSNNYYSSGDGGYYYEPIDNGGGGGDGGCDPSGTYIDGTSEPNYIFISELSNSYENGSNYSNTYADGNCGSYTESGTSYQEDGYEFGRDDSYSYLSDGVGGYRIGYPYDGEYNYPTDDDSVEDIGEQVAISYNGQGVDEATFYDESANAYVYDSYDVETGDVVFSAGAPQPAHGDWLRNSYGHIASTGRTPRMATVEIPNGWRSTNAYWINNSVPELKGATSIQIQVGWIYSGRKRWHSGLQRWVADSAFANSENEGGTTDADGAILPNNIKCILPTISAAGPKTFYEATENPSGGLANPFTFTAHNNYWAYSNGDGTARFQQD